MSELERPTSPASPIEKDDDPTLPTHICGAGPNCQCEAMRSAGDRLLGSATFLELYASASTEGSEPEDMPPIRTNGRDKETGTPVSLLDFGHR